VDASRHHLAMDEIKVVGREGESGISDQFRQLAREGWGLMADLPFKSSICGSKLSG